TSPLVMPVAGNTTRLACVIVIIFAGSRDVGFTLPDAADFRDPPFAARSIGSGSGSISRAPSSSRTPRNVAPRSRPSCVLAEYVIATVIDGFTQRMPFGTSDVSRFAGG